VDHHTIRLKIRDQAARDGDALLAAGIRLRGRSIACIEETGNSIIRSRARLVLSRVLLERSRRRLPLVSPLPAPL
jgi:hypothetical protein